MTVLTKLMLGLALLVGACLIGVMLRLGVEAVERWQAEREESEQRQTPLARAEGGDLPVADVPFEQRSRMPGMWIRPDDYPAESRRLEETGRVGVRCAFDRRGVVLGCSVDGSSGFYRLDRAAVILFERRGRFPEARPGEPEVRYRTTGVRRELPSD